MLLTNLKDTDLQAALDQIEGANKENAKTGMVPPKRNVMSLTTLAGIIASLEDDATEKALSDPEVRANIASAMHEFGCFKSLTEHPLATVNEVEKNQDQIKDYLCLPGLRRCFALRKDGKEYRKDGPELKGNLGRKWDTVEALIKRNTAGVARVIKNAAKIAKARVKSEGEADAEPVAPKKTTAKKTPPKKRTPPKSKAKKQKEEAPI